MKNVYDTLKERGFIAQATHEDEIRKLLGEEKVTFYIGFDPTADSLTIGHYVSVMLMAHMQRAGHRPIALMGGGTGMVGDPTLKTDMRRLMVKEEINNNVNRFKEQMSKFIDFSDGKAILEDNANWLLDLNYVNFIRDIGVHFSVNRMLTADCYKTRFEKGLTFFEFNYMLMQSYDFLELNKKYGCVLQMGGNDQWSNIIAGADLIRRKEKKDAFGLTTILLTTADGRKMGKTEAGAIWLDPKKTTPYEFFQYFRNVADDDVKKCLCILTFLDMEEIEKLSSLEGAEINKAKEVLAYEVTKIVHSEEEAKKALEASKALFGKGGNAGSTPTTKMTKEDFENGYGLLDLVDFIKISPSKGETRRIIKQGGLKINGEKVDDVSLAITLDHFENEELLIQKGKKVFHKITV